MSADALGGGDDAHQIYLLRVAAAGKVVDGGVQTLQNGADGHEAAEALSDLVADIAGLNFRENKGVGIAGDRAAGELQLADLRNEGGVKLHLAVAGELGVGLFDDGSGFPHHFRSGALGGTVGGERQHRDLRIDAEEPGGARGFHGDLRDLLSGAQGDIALVIHLVLIGYVDGAVGHGELLTAVRPEKQCTGIIAQEKTGIKAAAFGPPGRPNDSYQYPGCAGAEM